MVDEKRAEYAARNGTVATDEFPGGAVLCPKCHTKAMVQMAGCLTCLNCGESKCA